MFLGQEARDREGDILIYGIKFSMYLVQYVCRVTISVITEVERFILGTI